MFAQSNICLNPQKRCFDRIRWLFIWFYLEHMFNVQKHNWLKPKTTRPGGLSHFCSNNKYAIPFSDVRSYLRHFTNAYIYPIKWTTHGHVIFMVLCYGTWATGKSIVNQFRIGRFYCLLNSFGFVWAMNIMIL